MTIHVPAMKKVLQKWDTITFLTLFKKLKVNTRRHRASAPP